jgi:hypothetical protein
MKFRYIVSLMVEPVDPDAGLAAGDFRHAIGGLLNRQLQALSGRHYLLGMASVDAEPLIVEKTVIEYLPPEKEEEALPS